MRGKARLVARRLARLGVRLRGQPRVDRREPGFDFLEHEALLFGFVGAELFRAFAEAVATKRLDDRGQPIDLGFRRRVRLREVLDLRRQAQNFGELAASPSISELVGASRCCKRQRLELINVVWKFAEALDHASQDTAFVA